MRGAAEEGSKSKTASCLRAFMPSRFNFLGVDGLLVLADHAAAAAVGREEGGGDAPFLHRWILGIQAAVDGARDAVERAVALEVIGGRVDVELLGLERQHLA